MASYKPMTPEWLYWADETDKKSIVTGKTLMHMMTSENFVRFEADEVVSMEDTIELASIFMDNEDPIGIMKNLTGKYPEAISLEDSIDQLTLWKKEE
jgi:hypothetical protein